MCQAFSFLITVDCHAKWKFGMDSHEEIIKEFGFRDDGHGFARCEIAPKNKSYLLPDEWIFRLDEQAKPAWWTPAHEAEAWGAWKDWKKRLDNTLIYKPIVHPFRDIKPPKKITKKHLSLLEQWDSVRASIGASAWASIGASVRASIGASIGDSIRDSVGASAWDSVWASIGAYIGSFFNLPRPAWKHTEKIETKGYPFQPAADLWMMGLVPSFDGKTWRLHGGVDGKVIWKGRLA